MAVTYDSIISLGGFCGAARQLKIRGLRKYSMPFDWLFMEGPQTIAWLKGAFETDFHGFLRYEDIELFERQGTGVAPFSYRNKASGYCFIHHFFRAKDNGGYEDVAKIMSRRMARFLKVFSSGKSVLLVLATPFSFELHLAEDLLCAIRARFPHCRVDLHVIQYNVAFADETVLSRRIPSSYSFTGSLHARDCGTYDLHKTANEWSFLDAFVPSKRRYDVLWRLQYKLWKWLSKRLCDHGCGCSGLKF